jgi:hypothetical protein
VSKIKQFAEQISLEMGLGGELTKEVLEQAQQQLLTRSNNEKGHSTNREEARNERD